MNQTKLASLIESLANTFIGMVLTLALAPVVYPWFGHSFTMSQNLGIVLVFTVVSIGRGYAVRRWFNNRIKRMSARMAQAIKG